MESVRVNLGPRSYDVLVASGLLAGFGRHLSAWLPKSQSALIVHDERLEAIAARIRSSIALSRVGTLAIPSGESSKSPAQLARIYDALAELPADRQTIVVAVGGGVIGDLAGFAAATYNRGLPLVMVPTTLLAMVDSSVGGKVGINHAKGKNLIGSFHQPAGVVIDPDVLTTLPDREFRSGLAEVVKYGVIMDADFFREIEQQADSLLARNAGILCAVIARCCALKARVVEQDEREITERRAILNYGHTFAHAFETVGGYGSWLHGEAVAAGMVCASRLAELLRRIPSEVTEKQFAVLRTFHLPVAPKPEWPDDELIEVMKRDKKARSGSLRFVLPTRIGHVELVDDVPEALVRQVLSA